MKRRAESRHARSDREEDTNDRDGPVLKSRKSVVRSATSTTDYPAVSGQDSPDSSSSATSKRKIRSLAEKHRRDKLTGAISQLSTLLPLANTPDKKLDKCDILRLAVNYLKVQKYLINSDEKLKAHWPSWMTEEQLQKLLLESSDGFLLVVDKRGTILHLHESVSHYLGIPRNQITGHTIQTLVHPDDLHILYEHVPLLQPFQDGGKVSSSSSDGHLSFCVRVVCRNTTNKAGFFSYKFAHFKGHTQPLVEDNDGGGNLLPPLVLVAVVRPYMESVFKEMSSFFSRENEVIILHNLQGVCEFADQRMFKFGALATEIQSGSVYDQVDKEDLKYVSHAHNVIYDTSQTSTVFRIRRNIQLGYCHSITYVIKDRWTSRPKAFLSFFSVLSEKEGRLRWKRQDKEYRGMMAAKQTLSLPGGNTHMKEESLSPVSSSCSSSGSVDFTAVTSHKKRSPAGSSTRKEVPDGTSFGLHTLGDLTLSSDGHMGEKSTFGDKTGCGETMVWPVGCLSDTPPAQQAQFDNLQDISCSGSPLSFAQMVSSGESSPQTWSSPMSTCLTPSDTLQLSPTYTSPDVQTQNSTSQPSVPASLLTGLMTTQTSVSPVSPTGAVDSTSVLQNGHSGSGFISGTPEVAKAGDSGEMLGSLSTGDQEGKVTSQHPSVAVVHPTQARAMVSSNGPVDLQPLTDPLGVFTSPSEDAQPVLEASLTFLTPPSHSLMTEEYRFNRRLAKQQRQLSQQMQQYKREMQLVQNQIDLNQCIMKLQKLKGKEQDVSLLADLDRSVQMDNMYCQHSLGDQMDTAEAIPFSASLDLPSTSTTSTTQLPALQEVTNKNNQLWYKQGLSNSDSM